MQVLRGVGSHFSLVGRHFKFATGATFPCGLKLVEQRKVGKTDIIHKEEMHGIKSCVESVLSTLPVEKMSNTHATRKTRHQKGIEKRCQISS